MKHVNITKNTQLRDRIEQQKIASSSPRKSSKKWIAVLFSLFFLVALSYFVFGNNVKAVFDPVSIVGTISASDLKETDGRTNILILGSDKRTVGNVTSILTDTMLIASIGKVENDLVMISLPRDLWVKHPTGGYFSKINAVYANGGSEETKKVVEEVLGIPIHYYAVIDFNLFKETINILGGVDVNVENAFTDYYYPVEGKEDAPVEERYETLVFEQGLQHMDGDRALKFVRSRKGTNNEGTDFARSARQQKVIMAIKDKGLSIETLVNPLKLKELFDTYGQNVDSNVTLADIQNFYLLSQEVDLNNIRSIVLDDRSAAESGGLLYAPEDRNLYGGAYVLIPKAGDFSQLHAYVQRYIFGD